MAVKRTTYKKAVRGQLAALRADGYHTLAYRIATEQQQFGSARSLALLGLAVPDLPQEWHDRLAWLAGLYEYLDGNYGSAEKRWQDLINRTTDDGIRAAAYFWSARCQQQLGDMPAATKTIALLSRRYPLSYYAVVATKEAKINETSTLPAALGSLTDLPEALAKRRDFHVQAVRQSPLLGPLLSRAEVVTAANLGTIARQAVGELEQAMNPNLAVGSNLAAYVYLSRLQYRAGSYLAAISLTTKLAKVDPAFWSAWPEQVLVSFAQPYTEEYAYSAEHSGVARELLLGISRQESGFTADIRSSANAIGLMQLIPPTARRFAAELGLPTDHVEDLLRDPLTNIRLGSRYLKWLSLRYRGFPPTTYAAYNAGEYVVDLWLKRRAHSDPLMFVELIPFGETKDYVKSVWRNVFLYRHLLEADLPQELPGFDLGFAGVVGA